MKIATLETVASHGILFFREIMDKCVLLAGLNVPKVRPLVESLVQEGELIESKKQKNHEIHHYFEIAYIHEKLLAKTFTRDYSVESVHRLAKVLGCAIDDLME